MQERNHKTMAMLEIIGTIMRDIPESKLYEVSRAVYDLQKIAAQLHKRYEAACSYQWACTEKYERKTEKLESMAQEIGAGIGITVGHQHDPRGWPLVLIIGGREYSLA